MKILVDSQGRPLKSSDGFYAENFSYLDDVRSALSENQGVPVEAEYEDLDDAIRAMDTPQVLPIGSTTVRKTASSTENIVTNDNVRIKGSDGKKYTVAEWNALFVAAGYSKNAMTVQPVGVEVNAAGHSEVYLFDIFQGSIWGVTGETAPAAGQLPHSIYNNNLVTAAGSGTDYTTNKAWTVTEDGDNLVLSEANTGQSWTIAKNTGGVNARLAFNIEDRTYSLWAQTEWMRHRMAIDSGLSTNQADGTMADVSILNSSGAQAAAGEDMYFWIGGTNTNKLAKYNLNNRHTVASANLTQAIADAIYAKQIANGINMNDTGVNSASKPILATGSKGAEAIAVGGKWMIITPFISNPNATTATITNNIADSPAVYWYVYKGYSGPSDTLLDNMYINKTLVNAVINYLNSVEGWSLPAVPTSTYIWSVVRYSASYCWTVNFYAGGRAYYYTYLRYYVVGASAS